MPPKRVDATNAARAVPARASSSRPALGAGIAAKQGASVPAAVEAPMPLAAVPPPVPAPAAPRADAHVRVAVRVRPLNPMETSAGAACCVGVVGNTVTLVDPVSLEMTAGRGISLASLAAAAVSGGDPVSGGIPPSLAYSIPKRVFAYDHVFARAGQDRVYSDVGHRTLDHAWDGYNASVLAYGQTGSGKSYTMMGSSGVLDPGAVGNDIGLIPRICNALFERIAASEEHEAGSMARWAARRKDKLLRTAKKIARGGRTGDSIHDMVPRSLNASFDVAGGRRSLDDDEDDEDEDEEDEDDGAGGGRERTPSGTHTKYTVSVSYLEIYCERVRDLFGLEEAAAAVAAEGSDGQGGRGKAQRRKSGSSTTFSVGSAATDSRTRTTALSSGAAARGGSGATSVAAGPDPGHLRVREQPGKGAYVEGLREVPVTSYAEVEKLLVAGR
jgi:hypothetical protein